MHFSFWQLVQILYWNALTWTVWSFHKYSVLLNQPFLSPYIPQGYVLIWNLFPIKIKMGLVTLLRSLNWSGSSLLHGLLVTVCFIWYIFGTLLHLFILGYGRWRLRMSCGCYLAIWQPHVHISLPMCLANDKVTWICNCCCCYYYYWLYV